MSITLQSTVGGFSAEFMRRLPTLEQAMIAHGMEPTQFAISKDRASAAVPVIGSFFYDYTVFVGDDKFTVTEPKRQRLPGLLTWRWCVSICVLPYVCDPGFEPVSTIWFACQIKLTFGRRSRRL